MSCDPSTLKSGASSIGSLNTGRLLRACILCAGNLSHPPDGSKYVTLFGLHTPHTKTISKQQEHEGMITQEGDGHVLGRGTHTYVLASSKEAESGLIPKYRGKTFITMYPAAAPDAWR
jgi:hypothetical protein